MIMTLRIEIPEEIVLRGGDEIVIKVKGGEMSCEGNAMSCECNAMSCECGESDAREAREAAPTLKEHVAQTVEKLKGEGSERVAETYASTLRSFMRFRDGEDIALERLDAGVAEDYEAWLRRQGLSLNTVSFYMKRLRAIYNRAVARYGFADRKPFARCLTRNMATAKRALSVADIRRIACAETQDEGERLARDLFLFSYYTRGMSFVDIAFMKKGNVRDGILHYQRRKTGQELRVAWRPCMQQVVDRHPSRDGKHLLGILDEGMAKDLRWQCHAVQGRVNRWLHKLVGRIGLGKPVTMYCARHSWATIARENHVPMSVISDGMGHHSEKTTRIYLRGINAEEIDKCNDLLINEILKD